MARALEIRRPDGMIARILERHPRFSNWLYGFTPPERGIVVLVHRRVYIVPTRLGFYFAATLIVLLIGSINYVLSLGFALTFLLAGLGLVGMVHTARNLARLAVSAGRAELVLAGPAPRRGWLPLGRVMLETRFPLGLFRAWSHVEPDARCLVYPRPERSPLPPFTGEAVAGALHAPNPGSDDFA